MTSPLHRISIVVLALLPVTAFAQKVETSGLDHFWRIASTLEKGIEPTDSAWNAMWATPGYAILDQRERRRPLLTTAMRLALNPARRTSADSAIAKNSWLAAVIPHLREVAAKRDSLSNIERSFGDPATFARALDRAKQFLPPGTVDRLAPPEVSLVYFLDARGYSRILFDPLYLTTLPDPTLVLGHELHHYYGNQLGEDSKPFGDDMIAWRLSTTETEGIAGLVDKGNVPKLKREELPLYYRSARNLEYFEDYLEDYKRSNQWLAWTDAILRRVAASPDSTMQLGRILDATLPDNGRIMGAWMATVIDEQLGRTRLTETVAHPWKFWRTYNEAAVRSNGAAYVLSRDALTAIAASEGRYKK